MPDQSRTLDDMQAIAHDAVESLLDRNRGLQREVRQLRAALDRVTSLCDHAGKVSARAASTSAGSE